MLLTILGFLCGVVLSVRFDVLILLPAILLGWVLVIIGAVGAVGGGNGMSILLGMVTVAAALQGGYITGIVGQWGLRSSRVVPQSWPEKSAAAPDSAF